MRDRFADMSVAELINNWGIPVWEDKALETLKSRLGWKPGVGLGDLIKRHYTNPVIIQGVLGGGSRVKDTHRNGYDFQSMWKIIHERNGKTDQIATPILKSGWDYVDRRDSERGRFDMPADRIQDFLEDMEVDDYYMDELTDKQVGLMQAIFKAWRHWVRVVQKED